MAGKKLGRGRHNKKRSSWRNTRKQREERFPGDDTFIIITKMAGAVRIKEHLKIYNLMVSISLGAFIMKAILIK